MRGKRKAATMTYFQKVSRTVLSDDGLNLALRLDRFHNCTTNSTVEHVLVVGGVEKALVILILPSSGNRKLKNTLKYVGESKRRSRDAGVVMRGIPTRIPRSLK